jgi:hypothetical protein
MNTNFLTVSPIYLNLATMSQWLLYIYIYTHARAHTTHTRTHMRAHTNTPRMCARTRARAQTHTHRTTHTHTTQIYIFAFSFSKYNHKKCFTYRYVSTRTHLIYHATYNECLPVYKLPAPLLLVYRGPACSAAVVFILLIICLWDICE